MAKKTTKVTDNPKIRKKALSDGTISLYLDYYFGRENVYDPKKGKMVTKMLRKREYLSLYLTQRPRTPIEREQNRATWEMAMKIRFERAQEVLENGKGYRLKINSEDINFHEYIKSYIENYTKKDYRMITIAYNRFMDFLKSKSKYGGLIQCIKPEQITPDMIKEFTDYLQSRSVGEGAKSIYQRFKKIIKHAIEHDIMTKDPCANITIKVDDNVLRKDVLSQEEMQQLIATHYEFESPVIRRAFILCLYCGLRFCDVKDLTFANVDYSNKLLKFEQNKTKGHSANSGVVIPLNDSLLELIGKPQDQNKRDEKIFPLPSYEACLKALHRWVKHAGINKHISWHCARHSFATNILSNGANIKTVASLLGHSGLRYTEKYTRAVDSLKQDAINSLPKLKM